MPGPPERPEKGPPFDPPGPPLVPPGRRARNEPDAKPYASRRGTRLDMRTFTWVVDPELDE